MAEPGWNAMMTDHEVVNRRGNSDACPSAYEEVAPRPKSRGGGWFSESWAVPRL